MLLRRSLVRFLPALLLGLPLLFSAGCERALRLAVRIDSVDPADLAVRLSEADPPLVLDLRDAGEFARGHVPGARRVSVEGLEGYLSRALLAPERAVVLVCEDGLLSQFAGASAAARHAGPVLDVAGGVAAWNESGLPLEAGSGEVVPAKWLEPAVRSSSRVEQTVAFASAFVLKPAYMLLCLVLILVLAQSTSTPMRMLFWGLVSFEAGELFCALNYYFHPRGGWLHPLDLVHGAGMAGMGVLVSRALFRLADERVLHYGDPAQTCAVQRFCGRCWKRQEAPCGLHRLFLVTLPALAVLSLIPLSVPVRPLHFVTSIFGTWADYGEPLLNMLVEQQGYALFGAACFLWALARLRGGPGSTRRAELPFFLGLGFASFALFRFLLRNAFHDAPHWADFWEEMTEFVAIAGLGLFLLFFRGPLGPLGPAKAPRGQS